MTGYFMNEFVIGVINDCYHNEVAKLDKFMESNSDLIVKKNALSNGYINYIMIWDGSKEGWDTSKRADQVREKFISLLKSTKSDWYTIQDGEDYEKPITNSYKDEIREEKVFGSQ